MTRSLSATPCPDSFEMFGPEEYLRLEKALEPRFAALNKDGLALVYLSYVIGTAPLTMS